ncbi:hypothetical protein BO71DRAFT_434929 [Aspergillus ellipticus CBS 707.79]|uniref:Uncharacterized protein n=1 Tax=Aspergillus ellipticus CBS 707.79 TaxID=1448320 RepID=A0A319EE08_9EURO|nr:hypothetical protein BO71DRAFT_434929 [Aspergillus ellipticus CBS 707.79]
MCILEVHTDVYPHELRRSRVLQRCLLRRVGYCSRTRVVHLRERHHTRPPIRHASPEMRSLRQRIVDPREPREPREPRRASRPDPPRRRPSYGRSNSFRLFFPFLRRGPDSETTDSEREAHPRGRQRSPRPYVSERPDIPPIHREPRTSLPRRRPVAPQIRVISPRPAASPRPPPAVLRPRPVASPRPAILLPRPAAAPRPRPEAPSFREPRREHTRPAPIIRGPPRVQPRWEPPAMPPASRHDFTPDPKPETPTIPRPEIPATPLTPPPEPVKKVRPPRERSPVVEREPIRKPARVPGPSGLQDTPPHSRSPSKGRPEVRHVHFSDKVEHLSPESSETSSEPRRKPVHVSPRFYRNISSHAIHRHHSPGSEEPRRTASPYPDPPKPPRYYPAPPRHPHGIPPSRVGPPPRMYERRRPESPLRGGRRDRYHEGRRPPPRIIQEGGRFMAERGARVYNPSRGRREGVSTGYGRWRPRMRGSERYGDIRSGDERIAEDQGHRAWRWR